MTLANDCAVDIETLQEMVAAGWYSDRAEDAIRTAIRVMNLFLEAQAEIETDGS